MSPALSLALLAPARAQDAVTSGGDAPGLDAQRFRPAVHAERTLWTDDAQRGTSGSGTLRLLLHHTQEPLVWVGPDDEVVEIVENVLQTDLLGSFDLGRFRIGAAVPVVLSSQGDPYGQVTGLGDVGLDGRVIAVDGPNAPLGLALTGRLRLPTGTTDAPLDASGFTGEVALVVDREFGPVLLAANLGTRILPEAALENVALGDLLLLRAAAGWALTERAGVAAELNGDLGLADPGNPASTPVEALLGGWGRTNRGWTLRGAAGVGLTGAVGAPDYRLIVGLGYEPQPREIGDTDGDGWFDDVDACVAQPEDRDDWQDDDGCPDPDNDQDGVLDVSDGCPLEPEDRDAWRDEDGCVDPTTQVTVRVVDEAGAPVDTARVALAGGGAEQTHTGGSWTLELTPGAFTASGRSPAHLPAEAAFDVVDGPPQEVVVTLQPKPDVKVVVTRDRIDLRDKIYFHTASATIKPESYGLLDDAARILADYPEIRVLRVEGHTDSRGSDEANLDLSARRAASVVQYLVGRGIDPARLRSQGFGESRPLDPAETEAAWTKNRRVDFFVEDWRDQ